jgi:hypothetical protein
MALRLHRSIMGGLSILLVTSACAGQTIPASDAPYREPQDFPAPVHYTRPADTKSILKKLTKDVVIGSTVDPTNGDEGPRALSIVPKENIGLLSPGDLVVCNFENSAGVPGDGTTIELLNPTPGSQPVRFAQSSSIEGCDGDAIASYYDVFGAGLVSGDIMDFSSEGAEGNTFSGAPITAPFSDVDALPKQLFSPEFIFVGTTAGGIVSLSIGFYGNDLATQVAEGFAVNYGSGSLWNLLAPSGLQYDHALDSLYIVDGVTNTIVAFSNASELQDENEIVVQPGGKTFKCKYPSATCASLVYSGTPLDAPMASALLPNGNLIVANTQGTANTLVELTPKGQVLDTKVIDSSSTQGVFGLAAGGTKDSNTVLFYTDTNSNTVHELEQ